MRAVFCPLENLQTAVSAISPMRIFQSVGSPKYRKPTPYEALAGALSWVRFNVRSNLVDPACLRNPESVRHKLPLVAGLVGSVFLLAMNSSSF